MRAKFGPAAGHRPSALALAVLAGAMLFAGPVVRAAPSSGACIVRISTFEFDPSTAPSGSTTTLRTVVRNCTDVARHVTLTQYGTEPEGCPVLDPVPRRADIPPGGRMRSSSQWIAPDCAGRMRITLRVNGSGGAELDSATAVLRVTSG
jgi:hypothetical protein